MAAFLAQELFTVVFHFCQVELEAAQVALFNGAALWYPNQWDFKAVNSDRRVSGHYSILMLTLPSDQ